MAKFDLRFIDATSESEYIQCKEVDPENTEDGENFIEISGEYDGELFIIWLDKSTAIKFAKTLRTEINKITAREEGNNG